MLKPGIFKHFIQLAFNDSENINFADERHSSGTVISRERLLQLTLYDCEAIEHFKYICINPLKDMSIRSASNVAAWRNFIFEFDDISIAEQIIKIHTLGIPYTSLIFSGNKSIHMGIFLTEAISMEEHRTISRQLKQILNSDKACTSWALTRLGTGNQKILQLKNRVNLENLISWMQWNTLEIRDHADMSDKLLLEDYLITGGSIGHSHADALMAAFMLFRKGYTKAETLEIITEGRLKTTRKEPELAIQDAKHIVNYVYSR